MAAFQQDFTRSTATSAQLVPVKKLYQIYVSFCSFGKGHRVSVENLRMDTRTFQKFCRDAGLMDKNLNSTRLDLIFSKIRVKKDKKQKVIDFDSFIEALQECAKVLNIHYSVIQNHILNSNARPSLGGARRAPQLSAMVDYSGAYDGSSSANVYTVRRATENDLKSVVSLRIACALQQDATAQINSTAVSQGVRVGLIEHSSAGLLQPRYYVATYNENEIIGMMAVRPEWNDMNAKCSWKITSMYVEKNHSTEIVCYKLLKEGVMEDAVVLDVSTISINVLTNDTNLLDFYRKMEFVIDDYVELNKDIKYGLPEFQNSVIGNASSGEYQLSPVIAQKGVEWSGGSNTSN
jgi:hypothetical protein